jgi:hypothetical protein
MDNYRYIPIKGNQMTTYIFRVVVEPDGNDWHAYCPALLQYGAATWGTTKEEALKEMTEGGYNFHSIWRNLLTWFNKLDIEKIRKAAGIPNPQSATDRKI